MQVLMAVLGQPLGGTGIIYPELPAGLLPLNFRLQSTRLGYFEDRSTVRVPRSNTRVPRCLANYLEGCMWLDGQLVQSWGSGEGCDQSDSWDSWQPR